MTDEFSDLDENVLTYYVEVGTLNFVEWVTANGDTMVVEKENLDV